MIGKALCIQYDGVLNCSRSTRRFQEVYVCMHGIAPPKNCNVKKPTIRDFYVVHTEKPLVGFCIIALRMTVILPEGVRRG